MLNNLKTKYDNLSMINQNTNNYYEPNKRDFKNLLSYMKLHLIILGENCKSLIDFLNSIKNKDKIAENVVLKKEIKIVNLNTADTISFMNLPEIGPFFARNIVAYREKLGGFIDKQQLLEVYGLDSSRFEIIMPYINIDSVSIRKIRINHDDFKTILRHPYIEYEDVKKIVNYRETKGLITNWEQYKKVVTRDDIEERLRLYLEF